MTEFDINNIGLKVGLEIHQQLDTKRSYFVTAFQQKKKNLQENFQED